MSDEASVRALVRAAVRRARIVVACRTSMTGREQTG
jgi:hypothetical protein